ncbi:MAG: BMC domain-containing protein [Planctomycetes bacterium]|nr:BMC domain-containing protein [Planctomycetota bacterium]
MARPLYTNAIGMVETTGLVGAVEALDAMTKAAETGFAWRESSGGGSFTVIVRGSVGAVNAATEAGARAARAVGELACVHRIPKPDAQLDALLPPGGSHSRRPLPGVVALGSEG